MVSEMFKVHFMYGLLLSKLKMSSWRRGYEREKLKSFIAETYKYKRVVVQLFSSVCALGKNTMRLNLLDHFVKDLKRFRSVSFLDVPLYEQFCDHLSTAY